VNQNVDYQTQKVYISPRFLEFLMLIKINNLKEGTHQYTIDEPIASVGLGEPFIDRVNIILDLQKLHNQIVLKTELKLNVLFECDRCTSNFIATLISDYKIVYLLGNDADENDDSVDVVYLPTDVSEIYLDDDIHDYALLAIPMKKLCKEDCKGLCLKCGNNLNDGNCSCSNNDVDPRWLPLKELKNKIDTN
jgi:uncharacterized protein